MGGVGWGAKRAKCAKCAKRAKCAKLVSTFTHTTHTHTHTHTHRWDHVYGLADGVSVVCSPNGSIDLLNFPRMAFHFIERLPEGFGRGGNPTILIMDGHSSRWSPEGLRMLRDNNVHVWVIASHTSAWGQVGYVMYLCVCVCVCVHTCI